jgi:hypothetical protein
MTDSAEDRSINVFICFNDFIVLGIPLGSGIFLAHVATVGY